MGVNVWCLDAHFQLWSDQGWSVRMLLISLSQIAQFWIAAGVVYHGLSDHSLYVRNQSPMFYLPKGANPGQYFFCFF